MDLRKAFMYEEFEMYYQPLVNLQTNEITAFESLLRWNHPTRGLVSPGDFIPIAEETGLIVQLGEWVLRTACKEAIKWPEHIKIAVNLSPVQLKDRKLLDVVKSAIADSGLAASRLQLEITESILMQNTFATLAMLHELRKLGVQIAMDDFGTGYSSLSYLRSFPFDKIKIDRSFIRELGKENDCVAIIRAVIRLGKSLGMITTAEGVETQEQLDILRTEGCTQVQGYLFSQPKPVAEIPAMLQKLRPRIRAVS
jgi:EAL domain-containing protein (putative c-di-GMP-specific phosphodiesterase class I)